MWVNIKPPGLGHVSAVHFGYQFFDPQPVLPDCSVFWAPTLRVFCRDGCAVAKRYMGCDNARELRFPLFGGLDWWFGDLNFLGFVDVEWEATP